MKEYSLIEFSDGRKCIIVDMININNNKYFLLAKTNGVDIDNCFDIRKYDDLSNFFNEIEDEYEYNSIREIFSNRLDDLRKELIKIEIANNNIIKVKVIDVNNNIYTLEKVDGNKIVVNMEIFDGLKIMLNDYIYIKEDTLKEGITIRFGNIYNDRAEIIKIKRDNNMYYLQRYYG